MDLQGHNQVIESLDLIHLYCPYCNASMEDSFICDKCGYYAVTAATWPSVRREFFKYNKEWFKTNEIIL